MFAAHRERAGRSQVDLHLPQGASVDDAFNTLISTYHSLSETKSFTTFARNRRIVQGTATLEDGDELALLQPMSGGSGAIDDIPDVTVEILLQPLSADACIEQVSSPDCGGIAVFLGVVRDNFEGKATDHLEYEAYAEMAGEVIRTITEKAVQRWPIGRIAVQHRTGELEVGEISVIVAVSAPHRAEAFDACRYVIDELKVRAPIWKKEFGPDGETWVGTPATTG